MAIDIASFLPRQVIFHKVSKAPLGQKDLHTLDLAEAPIELNPRLIQYFRDRIIESLQKRFDVVHNEPPPLPIDDSGEPQPVRPRNAHPSHSTLLRSSPDRVIPAWSTACTPRG